MSGSFADAHSSGNVGCTLAPKWLIALELLDDAQRAALFARMRHSALPPRTMVFRQGDPSDGLILLNSGRIRIFQTSERGEDFTHGVCIGGSTIGLAALMLERPRDTSAETLDDAAISTLAKDDFQEFLHTMPAFAVGLAKLLATMAVESFARSGSLARDSARMRLGRTLLSLAQPVDPARLAKGYCVSGVTQEDLSRMIGVSRTWVVLMLGALSTGGVIVKERRRILIPSTRRLAQFVASEAFSSLPLHS
jgi:CRP/FNR family transcriptional regulator, cyclic AMP receptor protein